MFSTEPKADSPAEDYPTPEYARIDIDAAADFLNVSPRHVRGIIRWLIRHEVLASRCPQDSWSLKALPENFERLPVLGPTKRPGRPSKPLTTVVPASTSIAAYRQFHTATPTSTSNYPPMAAAPSGEEQPKTTEMDFPTVRQVFAVSTGDAQANKPEANLQAYEARVAALTDAALTAEHMGHPSVRDAILELAKQTRESQSNTREVQFRTSSEGDQKSISAVENSNSESGKSGSTTVEVNFRDAEMHCPINLGCPYLANDLADDKPVTFIRLTSQPAGLLAGPLPSRR